MVRSGWSTSRIAGSALAAAVTIAGLTLVPAGAAFAPTQTCTWTGNGTTSNWSDGGNWSEAGCNTSGPPAGAIVVFPNGPTKTTLTYDPTGTTNYDSLTFGATYTINSGTGTIELTPASGSTSCTGTVGICVTAGSPVVDPPVELGDAQGFVAPSSSTLDLGGGLSAAASGDTLTVNDSGDTGTVALLHAGTITSAVTVANGTLLLEDSNALGGATGSVVTVDNLGTLALNDNGGSALNVANTVVLGGFLSDQTSDTWSGRVEVPPSGYANPIASASKTLTLSGPIVDETTTTGNLVLGGSCAKGALYVTGTSNTTKSAVTIQAPVTVEAGASLGSGAVYLSGYGTSAVCGPSGGLPVGLLQGYGTIGGVSGVSGAYAPTTLWPGIANSSPGIITSTGAADLTGGGNFGVTLDGTTPGSGAGHNSELVVDSGGTKLSNAVLQVDDTDPTTGATFTIVSSPSGVTGQFTSPCSGNPVIADGGTFSTTCGGGGGRTLAVSYCSDSVVLKDVTGGGSAFACPSSTPTPTTTCPGGASCSSGTTSNSSVPASASSGGVSATASGGTGTVQVGNYSSNPEGTSPSNGTGQFFDIQLSPGNSFTQVSATIDTTSGGSSLSWWDPSANGGSGGWAPVVGHPGPTFSAGPPPSISVTFDSSSSPSLADLTGTVFAVTNASSPPTQGYLLAGSDGGVFAFGNAGYFGSLPGDGVHVNDIVGLTRTRDAGGYWLTGADGGIFALGDAAFHGSLPGDGVHVNDIVGMRATTDDAGYWLAGSDGGIFALGDAGYFGSLPGDGVHVNDIVAMAKTADGQGYWLVGSDGGIFAFGDAGYFGSLPSKGVHVNDIVGMIRTKDDGGYWLVGSDGGIFAFGDAPYIGSLPGDGVHVNDIVAITRTSTGDGYWLAGADGGIFAFGDAGYYGSLPGDGVRVGDIQRIEST